MTDDEQQQDGSADKPAPPTQQASEGDEHGGSAPETQQVGASGARPDGATPPAGDPPTANATTDVSGFPPPAAKPSSSHQATEETRGVGNDRSDHEQSGHGGHESAHDHQQPQQQSPPYQQPAHQPPGAGHQQPYQGYPDQREGYPDPLHGYQQQPGQQPQHESPQQQPPPFQHSPHQPPAQGYQEPPYHQPDYQQPAQDYEQPAHSFHQPPQGYNQPAQGYNQPAQGYEQPAQNFHQPAQGYNQPGPSYPQSATQAISPDSWQQQPAQQPDQYGPQSFAGDWNRQASQASKTGFGSRSGRIGIVAAVVLIAAVGGFAIWRALSGPSGAETPAAAAEQFFTSLDNEDLLGLAEISVPSERRSILEPSVDVLIELERLDILSDDVVDGDGNINDLAGITFDIPAEGEPGALVYETEPISGREDLQWVTVTEGLIEITYDPQVFRDALGGRFSEWLARDGTGSDLPIETETIDFAEELASGTPFEFAVVEEGGGYYVSYWYSVAGYATEGADTALLPAPAPTGADTPEQAAIDALDNLVDLEAEAVLTLLDPEEFRAAYDYWGNYSPDLIAEWEQARADATAEGVSWDLVSAEARSQERNGRTVAIYDELVFSIVSTRPEDQADVTITVNSDGMTVTGTIQNAPVELSITGTTIFGSATIDGEVAAIDFDLATYEGWFRIGTEVANVSRQDDCLLLSTSTEQELVCDSDLGFDGISSLLDFRQDWENALEGAGTPGLTMVERDGRWYVSGFPSYAYAGVDILKALEPEELDSLIDDYEELIESGIDNLDG